ncbi:MAG: DEAD/DEAH box helicase [Methyloprofundus sp.]|nr:DEAD/DEAH box helicase [Methyloprofundus sp.]
MNYDKDKISNLLRAEIEKVLDLSDKEILKVRADDFGPLVTLSLQGAWSGAQHGAASALIARYAEHLEINSELVDFFIDSSNDALPDYFSDWFVPYDLATTSEYGNTMRLGVKPGFAIISIRKQSKNIERIASRLLERLASKTNSFNHVYSSLPIFEVKITPKTSRLLKDMTAIVEADNPVIDALSITPHEGFGFEQTREGLNMVGKKDKRILLDPSSGLIHFYFPYHEKVLETVKRLPFSKFNNPEEGVPYWSVIPARVSRSDIELIVDRFDFYVEPLFFEKSQLVDNIPSALASFFERINIELNQNSLSISYPHGDIGVLKLREVLDAYSMRLIELDEETVSLKAHINSFTLKSLKKMAILMKGYGLNEDSVKVLRDLYRERKITEEHENERIKLSYAIKIDPDTVSIPSLNKAAGELSNYQLIPLKYCEDRNAILIADDQGVGKTLEAISLIEDKKAYPALINCLAVSKHNWAKEIVGNDYAEGWLEDKKVYVIESTKDEIPDDVDIVIVNYDLLSRDEVFEKLKNKKFKGVVNDESHCIKEEASKRTIAASFLTKEAELKILLSGTPMISKPKELIPQLEALGVMDSVFGGRDSYIARYCDPQMMKMGQRKIFDYNGATNLDELGEMLRAHVMVRRMKEDVMHEMPPKVRQEIDVKIDNRKVYSAVEKNYISAVEELIREDETFNRMYKSLKKKDEKKAFISEYMARYMKSFVDENGKESKSKAVVLRSQLKQLAGEGKIKQVAEFAKNILETGNKVVLFATHKNSQALLMEDLKEYKPLHILSSDTSSVGRQKTVDDFQNDPDKLLMVCSLKAANTSITLTAGSIALFPEIPESYSDLDQAEDRFHRRGQEDTVNSYLFVDRDTVDSELMKNMFGKELKQGVLMNDERDDEDCIMRVS